ncbi:MAG: sigma-70 family RNA polymerase sigma factor [Ginsengibacter sp.]
MKIINKQSFQEYSDTEIIHRILQTEPQLYEELIRRYNSLLYKIGRTYNYNHQDTEDLMQETNVSAYFNLAKFEKRSSYKTWLTRIMLNHCYQKRRKFSFKNEIPVEEYEIDNSNPMFQQKDNNEKNLMNKELKYVIEYALQNIPPNYKIVFTLRELGGFSVSETAAVLDILETNVKVRLNRAKLMLRTHIEKMYSPEEIYEFNLVYCDSMIKNVMTKIHILLENNSL